MDIRLSAVRGILITLAVLVAGAYWEGPAVHAQSVVPMQPGTYYSPANCASVQQSGGLYYCVPQPTPTPVPTATPVPSLVWKVPQVTALGQSVGYDPGSSPAAVMFQCGAWWLGQDDENTYAVVRFPGPTKIAGVKFGSYAWNGTGSLGTTGTMWLRDAGLLTETGADGRPLWHNNFRGDNDAGGGWSDDGIRANQIAPAFPNGSAGLTFEIPWGQTTYYTFTFPAVTVTDLRVELMDAGGGGSFTDLVGGLNILTQPGTPAGC